LEARNLIWRNDELKKEVFSRMHGGEGDIEILNIVKKEDLCGKARLIAKVTFGVGSSIGVHKHENEEEIFYILSGKGRLNIDGIDYEVKPGDSVITKSGSSHSFRNIHDKEKLVVLVVILLY
jgi:quercetin dioxygenase-like cupin family protein